MMFTWFALSGYYIATLGWRQLWFFQVAYVRQYVVSGWNAASMGLPQGLSISTILLLLQSLFAYIVLPCVYAACLWHCWRRSRDESEAAARLGVLTVVGAAMLAEVALSPNWLRIFAVSLPGVILLVWLTARLGRFARHVTGLLWIGVVGLAVAHIGSVQLHNSAIEDLPAGKVAAAPEAAEQLAWLALHTKPGEFMLQAEWPGMYLPLALRNPIFLDVVAGAGAARVENVELSVRQLAAKRVQYIVLSPRMETLDQYPELFSRFVRSHYRLVWTFSDGDEVWERETR